MGDKIVVGPINKGLRLDREPFVIDNDSFPTLINAYQWRGRIKRKRGTSFLGRLTRYFNSNSTAYRATATFALVAGAGNLFVGFGLQVNGNIVPGTVIITDTTSGNVYTDPAMDGTLVGAPGGSGTINYGTGDITILAGAGNLISAIFIYYPDLPVMGLEDLALNTSEFPGTLGFDTTYAYNINNTYPYNIYDVSFYKNPPVSAIYPGYIPKAVITPTTWNGQDYQQFWSVNYENAFWVTNGISVPFLTNNIGMQYKPILTVTITAAGPPAIATLQITAHGLVVGDFVFINEVLTTTGINFQTGYVIAVIDPNNVSVEFPNATLVGNGTGGIAQYLTNRSDITVDSLRWYDGDPTNGNPTNPVLNGSSGWVNFSPPLSRLPYSISDLPQAQYYLVGARMIVPFKDRLLFLGPVIQTSAVGSQIYLQDTIIYSQNGTPYYTASFTGDPSLATTVFFPILTPIVNPAIPIYQSASPAAYWEDQTGFGGFVRAGIDQPINTCGSNEDVLIIGFPTIQTKLVYSGNDIIPFNFYLINSELGSSSTFSVIDMDQGVLTRGDRGYIITNQTQCARIDLVIPDQVFQIRLLENGTERICSQRDFINEWCYFTYPDDELDYKFPNQTLQYNYRDESWAIFNETYTTYGAFRQQTGFTWDTVGTIFSTWKKWNEPWNAGSSNLLQPKVIAGNQQGFIVFRDDGTNESNSLYIQSFASSVVTSPSHTLSEGDFITISGVIGTIGTQVNNKIFSVSNPTTDTFILNPTISAGTYFGGGVIQRMYIPQIQTKQFPVAWGMGRKTRLGVQQYLLSRTDNAQIQLLIFLSQDDTSEYNAGEILPGINCVNGTLIYSTTLYTCPESTNLGLTPANTNLQMPTASTQNQIWHRINTSLIGDTVQLGFTLSDEQMRTVDDEGSPISQFSEIELHGIILDVTPSSLLA